SERRSNLRWLVADNSLGPLRPKVQVVGKVVLARQIHAGDVREGPALERHQRARRNLRIGAWRRLASIFHPLIHFLDQGAPKPLDRVWIVPLLGGVIRIARRAFLRREDGREVLQSGQQIYADVVSQRDVLRAVGGGMNQ